VQTCLEGGGRRGAAPRCGEGGIAPSASGRSRPARANAGLAIAAGAGEPLDGEKRSRVPLLQRAIRNWLQQKFLNRETGCRRPPKPGVAGSSPATLGSVPSGGLEAFQLYCWFLLGVLGARSVPRRGGLPRDPEALGRQQRARRPSPPARRRGRSDQLSSVRCCHIFTPGDATPGARRQMQVAPSVAPWRASRLLREQKGSTLAGLSR
jgi:hypothetical protein